MVKNKKDVLEDFWNDTLREIVDSEIKITLLKKHKPQDIIYNKTVMRKTFDGKPFPLEKAFTAGQLLKEEEEKWRGHLEVLDTIKELLKLCG